MVTVILPGEDLQTDTYLYCMAILPPQIRYKAIGLSLEISNSISYAT